MLKTTRELTRTNTRSLVSDLADGGDQQRPVDWQTLVSLCARIFGVDARERLNNITQYDDCSGMMPIRNAAAEWRCFSIEPGEEDWYDRSSLKTILTKWFDARRATFIIEGEYPPMLER